MTLNRKSSGDTSAALLDAGTMGGASITGTMVSGARRPSDASAAASPTPANATTLFSGLESTPSVSVPELTPFSTPELVPSISVPELAPSPLTSDEGPPDFDRP